MFVDVAFQVYADFLFYYGPVGFFFGVGLLDRFHNYIAGAGQEFVAVVARGRE